MSESIKNKLDIINDNIKKYSDKSVRLVAVSKYTDNKSILEAYQAGQRDFGESYVQNLVKRQAELPEDIRWHMIGHLQKNKVKYLSKLENLVCIHSVDSIKLIEEIEKRFDRPIECLVEINVSRENSKSGIPVEKIDEFFEQLLELKFEKVKIAGLMTISVFDGDINDKEKCFKELKSIKDIINKKYKNSRLSLGELSMGMTDDYCLALENGSTMIRIGSFIFS